MYAISPADSVYPEGPLHPFDLKKSDQIFFQWNPQIRAWNDEWWKATEPPYVKVDSASLLITFMTRPVSWALCPATVADSLKARGIAKIHPLKVTPPNRICYLLQKKPVNGTYPEAVEIFVDCFYRLQMQHPWRYVKEN